MRATIRRAVEAHKAQREENGDAGFSLIELIIVVVILGVLAAIAIPIFLNVQQDARNNAASTVAANAASQAAAQLAQDEPVADVRTSLASTFVEADGPTTGLTLAVNGTNDIDSVCVTIVYSGVTDPDFLSAGPGCS